MTGGEPVVAAWTDGDTEIERLAVVWLAPQARERLVFVAVGGFMIVAGGLVAAVNGAASFAHGSWLAAYLVLVGGVAQLGLGFGCLLLPEPNRSRTLRGMQLGLWNVGMLAVAAGVLADLHGLVLAGSLLVAAALVSFAAGGGPVRESHRRAVVAYRLLITFLAVSVVVGTLLAGASGGS